VSRQHPTTSNDDGLACKLRRNLLLLIYVAVAVTFILLLALRDAS
jgi:hypothetical protein